MVAAMNEYVAATNRLVSLSVGGEDIYKYTTKDVDAMLTSAMRHECIRDALSVLKRHKRHGGNVPVLKKPCCYVNKWNYRIGDDEVVFSVIKDGSIKRIHVKARLTDRQKDLFQKHKKSSMRLCVKSGKIVAQIAYEIPAEETQYGGGDMGVDLGLKCPAVSYTSDGHIKFHGNGRKNKYIRRRFDSRKRDLQRRGKIDAVRRIDDKEKRIMRDIDHKISRSIVDEAKSRGVEVIKMEHLTKIRSTTRTSRKNRKALRGWTFYRLATYISYKAEMAGMTVEIVNPAYTSQTCPNCGKRNKARGRTYSCKCGFRLHRDAVGALNICNSTECVGGTRTRRTA